MTLVVALIGSEAIWLLTDRRLTRDGQLASDEATKIVGLDTLEGRALLGYAGLGRTEALMQPSEWMANVLRGRNGTLEQLLGVLAGVAELEIPPHLGGISPAHFVLIPAIVANQPRAYSIRIDSTSDGHKLSWTRHFRRPHSGKPEERPPYLMLAGSGANYLGARKGWVRKLLRLVGRFDAGECSAESVADALGDLGYEVHRSVDSVGPTAVVAWRIVDQGEHHRGGGGHLGYINGKRGDPAVRIPQVALGNDLLAVGDRMMNFMLSQMVNGNFPDEPIDPRKLEAAMDVPPEPPDDRLR